MNVNVRFLNSSQLNGTYRGFTNRFCLWLFSQRVFGNERINFGSIWPTFKRSLCLSLSLSLPFPSIRSFSLSRSVFAKCVCVCAVCISAIRICNRILKSVSITRSSDGLIVFAVFVAFIQEFGFNLSPIHTAMKSMTTPYWMICSQALQSNPKPTLWIAKFHPKLGWPENSGTFNKIS